MVMTMYGSCLLPQVWIWVVSWGWFVGGVVGWFVGGALFGVGGDCVEEGGVVVVDGLWWFGVVCCGCGFGVDAYDVVLDLSGWFWFVGDYYVVCGVVFAWLGVVWDVLVGGGVVGGVV